MNRNLTFTALAIAGLVTLALLSQAQADTQTLTGVVTDMMCGAKHMIAGRTDAECTRICVKQGSQYALLVGDKLYTLQGDMASIDRYAGQHVTVTGTVNGNNLKVEAIKSAGTRT